MKHACLKVGQHLILDDQSLEIIRINEDNFYQLERKQDFKLINRTRAEILTALESGSLKFTCSNEGNTRNNIQSRDLESFSKVQQETAKRRMDYVRNAQKLGTCLKQLQTNAKKIPALSLSSLLYRVKRNPGLKICLLISGNKDG